MISQIFLKFTLLGSQWVLVFLILLSIASISLILERWMFFRGASRVLEKSITDSLREIPSGDRVSRGGYVTDGLLADARLRAESRLSWLATIGSNAPFIGLLGTVLGIIRAFHDLSQQGTQGSTIVSAGISEALVATAVGLLVAIPAAVSYNYFLRRVKDMLLIADRAKNRILGEKA